MFNKNGRGGHFTEPGISELYNLYDYQCILVSIMDPEAEFDPSALCLEWDEFETMDEAMNSLGIPDASFEDLFNKTATLLPDNGNVLVRKIK